MFFTDKAFSAPHQGHTIFAHTGDHDIPVLNFIPGEGPALPEQAIDAVIKNVASVLNGNEPAKPVDLHAVQAGWEQQSAGLRLYVRHGTAAEERSSIYVMFNQGCPPELVRHVFNCLASGGMGKVLAQIH